MPENKIDLRKTEQNLADIGKAIRKTGEELAQLNRLLKEMLQANREFLESQKETQDGE